MTVCHVCGVRPLLSGRTVCVVRRAGPVCSPGPGKHTHTHAAAPPPPPPPLTLTKSSMNLATFPCCHIRAPSDQSHEALPQSLVFKLSDESQSTASRPFRLPLSNQRPAAPVNTSHRPINKVQNIKMGGPNRGEEALANGRARTAKTRPADQCPCESRGAAG